MIESCYNCLKYLTAKKNKDYIKVPEDDKHLPYKQYNGCMMLKVFLDTKTNLNKQDSEATQLKTRGCNQWINFEEEKQLSIFDFIK